MVIQLENQMTVLAISDSGIFFETPKYNPASVSRLEGITRGWSWWTPTLEGAPSCKAAYPNAPWNCSIASYGLNTLKTTTFGFTALSGNKHIISNNPSTSGIQSSLLQLCSKCHVYFDDLCLLCNFRSYPYHCSKFWSI